MWKCGFSLKERPPYTVCLLARIAPTEGSGAVGASGLQGLSGSDLS